MAIVSLSTASQIQSFDFFFEQNATTHPIPSPIFSSIVSAFPVEDASANDRRQDSSTSKPPHCLLRESVRYPEIPFPRDTAEVPDASFLWVYRDREVLSRCTRILGRDTVGVVSENRSL